MIPVASRGGYTLSIELSCHSAGRLPARVLGENSANDGGLTLLDKNEMIYAKLEQLPRY